MSRDYMQRMLRRDDRRVMWGRCTITRGTYPNLETVGEDVRCAVRPSQKATTEVTSGGEQVGLHLYDVRLPIGQDVARGDVITVTRSHDGLLEGRWITVVEVVADEWVATRIAVCQESRSSQASTVGGGS